MSEFLTIRHSRDDHSYIDGKNNTSLTCEGIEIAKNMSNEVLNCVDDRKIIVRHSTKKRAIETAEILCERFDKNNIDYEVKSDSNLTELYQGEFRNLDLLNHEERIQLLQSCWEEFDEHRLNNNLDYRFGDYKNAINKKIDSRFTVDPFGESQRDFSIRIGKAVLSIRRDMQDGFLPINITHRGAIREIKNLLRSVNENVPMEQIEDYEIFGMKYCEIVKCNFDNFKLAEQSLIRYIKERSKYEDHN
jgi:hypothetical protein cdivTM_06957